LHRTCPAGHAGIDASGTPTSGTLASTVGGRDASTPGGGFELEGGVE
jgi:hypothetical protein